MAYRGPSEFPLGATPAATPSASRTPTPLATPVPTPSASPAGSAAPSATPTPMASATPTPSASAFTTPLATPTPTPLPSPVPSPSGTPYGSAAPSPAPTPYGSAAPSPYGSAAPTPTPTPKSSPFPSRSTSPEPADAEQRRAPKQPSEAQRGAAEAAAAAAAVRHAFEEGRLDLMTDYEFSQFLSLLADLLKRGDFSDVGTKEAVSAVATLMATHGERVLKPRESFEALVKGLTQLLGKLDEQTAGEETEGAQLAAEAVYNILAHDDARYRVLASLPAGEVATLLKNLLPLLASGERDTLVPATRSLTLVLEEDEGRRRALSALKDAALRAMVLGLGLLLRSPDAEVAYAALEACLKLLLDEETSKRVLLVLAERELGALVVALEPLLGAEDEETARSVAQALRNLMDGPESRRRVLAGLSLEQLAKVVESCTALLVCADEELLQCTVLNLNHLLDEEDGRRRVLASLPGDTFETLVRTLTPLLGSVDDDVASTAALLVFKLVAVPEGRMAVVRSQDMVGGLLAGLTPLLSNRHEEFENGSAYNAAEAVHSMLSEQEGRDCVLALPVEVLTRLVKALTPVLGSAHVDTAYAAAGSVEKLLADTHNDSLGRRRVLALPLAALRALVMSFTPLLGSPHEETAAAAFVSVRRLLDAPEGTGLVLAALRDDALGALVKGLTPLLSVTAGRAASERCGAAVAVRKVLDEPAGRRRALAALPEEDALGLITQLVLLMGAGRSDADTMYAAAASVRAVLVEALGRKRALALGDETFALLARGLLPLLYVSRAEAGEEYLDMTRWAAEALCAVLSEFEGRAKVLAALNGDDFAVLMKGLAPLLSGEDGGVALTATECVRALAVEEEGCRRILTGVPPDALAAVIHGLSGLLPSADGDKARIAAAAVRALLEAEDGTRRVLSLLPDGAETLLVRGLAALLSSADAQTLIAAVLSLNALLDEESGRRRVMGALPEGAFTTLARGVTPLLRSPEEETACSAADALFKLLTLAEGRRNLAAAPEAVTRAIVDGLTRLMSRRSEATTYAAVGAVFNLLTEEEGRTAVLALPEDIVAALVVALIPLLGGADGDTAYAAAGTAVRLMLEPEGLRRVLALSPSAMGALVGQLTSLLGDAAEPTARAAFEALKRLLEEAEGVSCVLASLPDDAAVGELARRITPLLSSREHARAAAASLSKLMDTEDGRRRVLAALSEGAVCALVAGLTPLMATRAGGSRLGAQPSDMLPDPEAQRYSTAAVRNLLNQGLGRRRVIALPEPLFMQLLCEDITLLGSADIETARSAVEVVRAILEEDDGRVRVLSTLHEEAWGFSALVRELIPLLGSPDGATARATAQAVRSLLSEEAGRLRVVAQPEVALRGLLRWMTLLLGSPDGDTVRAAALGLGFLLFEGGFARLLLLPKEALEALVAKLSLVLVSSTGRDESTSLVAASVATGLVVVHDGRARRLALPEDIAAAIVQGLTPLLSSAEAATVEDAVSTLTALLQVQWPRARVLALPPAAVGALVSGLAPLVPVSRAALAAALLLLSGEDAYARVLYAVPPDTAAGLVRALAAAGPATGRRDCTEAAARGLLFLFFNKGFSGPPPEGGLGPLLVAALLTLSQGAPDGALARLVAAAPPPTVRAALVVLAEELRAGAGDAAGAARALFALLHRRKDFWRAACRILKAALPLYDRRALCAVLAREHTGAAAAVEGAAQPQPQALRLVASPGRPLAAQACEAVLGAQPAQLLVGLSVEGWAPDASSLEAVSLMAEEIAGESSGLFKALPAERCMHPRATSAPEHVPLFRLLGRLLGLSLARGVPLPVRLSRLFYKLLFAAEEDGETLRLEDVRYVDAPLHDQLKELLVQPLAQDAGLVFADDVPEAGEPVPVALLPGGCQLQVSDANKAAFVALKVVARVKRATDPAIRVALRSGLADILPAACLDSALFDAAELQELVEGEVGN